VQNVNGSCYLSMLSLCTVFELVLVQVKRILNMVVYYCGLCFCMKAILGLSLARVPKWVL
jgi:hypothetical protein